MALGRKVNHRPRPMLAVKAGHQLGIADVSAHERVARVALQFRQICWVARVRQQVEIQDRIPGILQPA